MPSRRRQRGHIRSLPSVSFQAIVYAGTDPLTGKERYLRETAATYGAAEQALTRLQGQVDEDRHPKTAITVRQGRCCIVRSRVAATVDPGWSDRQGQLVEGGQDL
jgi:hypothetical protein